MSMMITAQNVTDFLLFFFFFIIFIHLSRYCQSHQEQARCSKL